MSSVVADDKVDATRRNRRVLLREREKVKEINPFMVSRLFIFPPSTLSLGIRPDDNATDYC